MPAPARRRRGLRWLVAAAIVVLVAASASAAFFIMTGAASPSTVARWAPADTIIYMEARFDLPGDQHAKAGQFLSAFPGFADPASLDAKLGELYDKAIKSGIGRQVRLLDRHQALVRRAGRPWPSRRCRARGPLTSARATPFHGAILLSVTDAAKASAWLTKVIAGKGDAATYGGVSLTVSGTGDKATAVGVDDVVLIGGDLDTVHKIIDAKGADGLAATADFKSRARQLTEGSGRLLLPAAEEVHRCQTALTPSLMPMTEELLDKIPAWVGGSALFESDSLILDEVAPSRPGDARRTGPARSRRTCRRAPWRRWRSRRRQGHQGRDQGLSGIPAYKEALTWPSTRSTRPAGSTRTPRGSATSRRGHGRRDTVGGGLVVTLQDKAASDAAGAKFAALKNLVALAGSARRQGHERSARRRDDHHDRPRVRQGPLKLVPGSGTGSGLDSGLPASVTDARIALSYTVTDDLAIVGVGGDGFVKAVLDTKSGSSLADQAGYKAAIGLAGASNASQGYVDVAAIVKAIEAQLPADTLKAYQTDTKPYLAPFAGFGSARRVETCSTSDSW